MTTRGYASMSAADRIGLIKSKQLRWTFAVGTGAHAVVTVRADAYSDAVDRARSTMDRRYERLKREPPVAWGFYLLEATR